MNLDDYGLDDAAKAKLLAAIQAEQQAAIDKEVEGLKNKRDELLAKLANSKDTDSVEAMKAMLKQLNDQREADLLKSGNIEELLKLKIDNETSGLNSQIEQLQERDKKLEADLEKAQNANTLMQIENEIRLATGKVGDFNQAAATDLLNRASGVWQIKDGAMTAFNGEKQLLSDKATPITPTEWIEGMRESAPHFFGKATGGGSKGGSSDHNGYEKYFKSGDDFNLTKQAELMRDNPALYKTLKAQGA